MADDTKTGSSETDQEHIFMKLDGIDGEVEGGDFDGQSAIREFNYEVKLPLTKNRTRGGVTTDKSQHGHIMVKKVSDLASVKMWQHCCEGKAIAEVTFNWVRFSQGEMVVSREIVLTDVMVAQYGHVGNFPGHTDLPMEEVHMDFSTIKDTYTQQNSDGTTGGNVTFTWDNKLAVAG
jgi:type VI secretion system secreted protein Hcp|tara:strand:+ start:673 stop:1203 length:531 start_codon:yes stop_codon:yes gene_type:complete